jgi:pilus assembly protein CpaE
MAAKPESTRVIFIGDPGTVQQQIAAALGSQTEFQLVDVISSSERLVREIHAAEPNIILIDHALGGQPTIDMIDDITLQYPDAAVITILHDNDPVLIQQSTLAGARAFIVQPFTQVNLLSTMRRVQELEARRGKTQVVSDAGKVEESRPLRSLAVFSPRGGVGSSTVALNLAVALYEDTGARVLLMEGKFFFGHLDVMLNIRARNTIADLLPHASSLDENLVREVVCSHASGIKVLLAPSDLQVGQGVRPDDIYSVFINLQRFFDYTIVDVGSYLTENTVTLMDTADKIMLVTTPDLASLHDTSRFIQLSRSLGYPADKILILLNRADMLGGVKSKDIEAALHHQVFAQIPDDHANALRSLNRGIPLVVRYPRSPASRAIHQLTKRLPQAGVLEPVAAKPVAVTSKSQQEVLLASSQLG